MTLSARKLWHPFAPKQSLFLLLHLLLKQEKAPTNPEGEQNKCLKFKTQRKQSPVYFAVLPPTERGGNKNTCYLQNPLLTPGQFFSSTLFLQEHKADCEIQPPLRQKTSACLQSIPDHSNSTIQNPLTFSKWNQGRNFERGNNCPTAVKTRVQNWKSIQTHNLKNLLYAPVWFELH